MSFTFAEVLGRARPRHCEGKIPHATAADAESAVARLRAHEWCEHPETLGVYACRYCCAWHVGHRTRPDEPRAVSASS